MAVPAFVDSWSAFYSGSALVRSMVNFAHLGGLVGGGGCAIAADRAVLRAWSRGTEGRRAHREAWHSAHGVVVAGLVLVMVSGVLLLGADLDAYVESTVFWFKMALVALLLGNGLLVLRAERRVERGDASGWLVLRRVSIASLILWFATTLAGVVLPNAL